MFGVKLTIFLGIVTFIYYLVLGLIVSNLPTEVRRRMRELDEYSNGILIAAFVFIMLCISTGVGILYSLAYILFLR